MSDQANEQSYDSIDDAATALIDVLDPQDSQEQPADEDADEFDTDADQQDDADELDDGEDDQDVDDDETDQEDDEESDEAPDDSDEEEGEVYELADDDVLTIDGQQITFKELREGQLRQADYTRKTQELAAQTRQVEQYLQQQGQVNEQQSQRLGALTQMLEQQVMADQNIPWDQIASDDPAAYVQLKEQAAQRQQILQQVMHENQLTVQQNQQQQQVQHHQYLEEQRQALLKEWPHWNDPTKKAAHMQQIQDYLQNNGISEQEAKSIANFNVLKLAEKARKYDELQAKKPRTKKRLKTAPKMVKPNARKSKSEQRQQKVAAQTKRLRQTGSVHDAAGLLLDRL